MGVQYRRRAAAQIRRGALRRFRQSQLELAWQDPVGYFPGSAGDRRFGRTAVGRSRYPREGSEIFLVAVRQESDQQILHQRPEAGNGARPLYPARLSPSGWREAVVKRLTEDRRRVVQGERVS